MRDTFETILFWIVMISSLVQIVCFHHFKTTPHDLILKDGQKIQIIYDAEKLEFRELTK